MYQGTNTRQDENTSYARNIMYQGTNTRQDENTSYATVFLLDKEQTQLCLDIGWQEI